MFNSVKVDHWTFTELSFCFKALKNSNSTGRTTEPQAPVDEETLGEEAVFVYPNPAKEFINVEFSGLSDENISIEIIDVFGKVVQKENRKNENGIFNLLTWYQPDIILSYGFLIKQNL